MWGYPIKKGTIVSIDTGVNTNKAWMVPFA